VWDNVYHNPLFEVRSDDAYDDAYIKIKELISDDIPCERSSLNIAMWMASLTLAFAISIYAFTNIKYNK